MRLGGSLVLPKIAVEIDQHDGVTPAPTPDEDAMTAPTAGTEGGDTAAAFEALDQSLVVSGPNAAIDGLIAWLDARGDARTLLDALLLKARHDLGLPLVQVGSLVEIPEPARTAYEDRYIEAIRRVGRKMIDAGDLVAAWPYYRAIGEKEPIARAIDAYDPGDREPGDERLGQVVDIAFNQGVHPRRGFDLILDHYGACSAITAFEHLPPDDATRLACADRLVRHIHDHLVANLRSEITRRGQPQPPDGATIADLIAGREWLFVDDAYHLDISHLSAVVRLSPMLVDPATIALAVGLTDYGRNLSDRHRYDGEPPFDNLYDDHATYLRGLLGDDPDAAVAHFLAKLPAAPTDPTDESTFDDPVPAQVLVRLLVRLNRLDEAIDVASEHLAGYPESMLGCPGVAQLCQMAGRPDRLSKIAREQGDIVHYAAAVLQSFCSR